MKILGFEVKRDANSDESVTSYLDAISAVMENPRISIESGKKIIEMFINNQLTPEQLYGYVYSQGNPDVIPQDQIFENLDLWNAEVGPFSKQDILYLQSQSTTSKYKPQMNDIPSITDYICDRVIGQDEAVKSIVTAAWLHCTSIRKDLGIKVPAQLLIGQTGVGKTQILNLLSQVLNVPVINIFASTITAPGYRGGDSLTDQIFSQYSSLDISPQTRTPVIICIHEIDKAVRGHNDGYRVELLSSIMSLIEKCVIYKSSPISGAEEFDLNNALVMFDGCFDGIEKITARRLGLNQMGFANAQQEKNMTLRSKITKGDLLQYGMMTEFVGRIADPICLQGMTSALMYKIVSQSVDSPIACYVSAFKHAGINLRFSTGALKLIAQTAYENGTFGARSIETIVNELMQPYITLLSSSSKKNIQIDRRAISRFISKKESLKR